MQAAQALLVPQIGVVGEEHWELVRHATQMFVVVSQTGVPPPHWLLAVHWTQEPSERQAVADVDLAAHCASAEQMAHVLAPLQIGAVAPQVVLVKHPTQVFVVVSQTDAVAEQSAFWEH